MISHHVTTLYGATWKKHIYASPLTLIKLKTNITKVIHTRNDDMLNNVFENMKHCVNFVIHQEGGHFEHLIN